MNDIMTIRILYNIASVSSGARPAVKSVSRTDTYAYWITVILCSCDVGRFLKYLYK